MRKTHLLNQDWIFTYFDGEKSKINIPHTWNNIDGQDGGNDYRRGTCIYEKDFVAPQYNDNECVYLEFAGVNASAKVILNDIEIMTHDGGYSTFRCDITEHLKPQNHLTVEVDNSVNDRVYPQTADFTFYGGLYRDVNLIAVPESHFDLMYFGGPGIAVTPAAEGKNARVRTKVFLSGAKKGQKLRYTLRDAQENPQNYKNLQIRVCGWNVLWNNISKEEQDGFIRQAESLI